MSLIRIEDISHVRFTAPDLDQMERFLVSFGLTPFRDDSGRLFGRGSGGAPFMHMTEVGEPGFAAIGFRASGLADLEVLAAAEDARVEPFSAPGGGSVGPLTTWRFVDVPEAPGTGRILSPVDASDAHAEAAHSR